MKTHIQQGHKRIVSALFVDSGAVGNFIDHDFAAQLGESLETSSRPINIIVIDGWTLSKSPIVHQTQLLTLIIDDHQETIQFLVTSPPLLLGFPWLLLHDLLIC